MKISYAWLRQYLPIDLPAEKVAELLTHTGLEVEGLETIDAVPGGLRGVVTGRILRCEAHPNADKLQLTQVDLGQETPVQIVCGAPNVAEGQDVPVATVGTELPTEEGPFTIKKSKLRGEVSEGMICSEKELNLGPGHEGILVLDGKPAPGTPAARYFELESDQVFEIGLTPNRTDAISHYGVARDLRAALLRYEMDPPALNRPSVAHFVEEGNAMPIDIQIADAACHFYAGTVIRDVQIGASPSWLQNRLRAIGLQPVNNVVDITNYLLHETGHPLHAFDAERIHGQSIQIKKWPAGTPFTTLDGKERKLDAQDLTVSDAQRPLVLAGVMGGIDSGVTADTRHVFLESARFDPVHVRKSAKRHALNTDASFRYERGIDPELSLYVLKRAALLIQELAGGSVAMTIREEKTQSPKPQEVTLNLDYLRRLIGQEIPGEMVRSILHWLDIRITAENGRDWHLEIPLYRHDVSRPADVCEEILRIYGFNAVKPPAQMRISLSATEEKPGLQLENRLSEGLRARGFQEIINNSLTASRYFEKFGFSDQQSVYMLNPLSQDLNVLRQSLLPGGLATIAYNVRRQQNDLRLFEWGRQYQQYPDGYQEKPVLALWITGRENPENWRNDDQAADFFTLKAEAQAVLSALGIDNPKEKVLEHPAFSSALEFRQGKRKLGRMGQVSVPLLQAHELEQAVYYLEFYWDVLSQQAGPGQPLFQELPRFPAVRRDLALLVDQEVSYDQLQQAARQAERKILQAVSLFDVYEGDKLPPGKKSYALRFVLQDPAKTLHEKQVEKTMANIQTALEKQCGAQLR